VHIVDYLNTFQSVIEYTNNILNHTLDSVNQASSVSFFKVASVNPDRKF